MTCYVKENEYNLYVVPVLDGESRLMDKDTKFVLKKQKGLGLNKLFEVILDIPKKLIKPGFITPGLLNARGFEVLNDVDESKMKKLEVFVRY